MNKVLSAVLIMIGLGLGGWFIGHGFTESRQPTRSVVVKGVAEKDVNADLALWTLQYVRAGDNLDALHQAIDRDDDLVNKFFNENHISSQEIVSKNLSVKDKQTNEYMDHNEAPRYILTRTLLLRSNDVQKIAKAYTESSKLISHGVVLGSSNNYSSNNMPIYLFNGLNSIKAEMIQDATQNARHAADEFAKNTNTELGKIIKADQGVFQILPRDKAPMLMEQNQINKTVRVVSTITFQLN